MPKGVYDHYKIRGKHPSKRTIEKRAKSLEGHIVTEETKQKIREAQLKKWQELGYREKMREADKKAGKKRWEDPEYRKNQSKSHEGHITTEESKQKNRKAHVGKFPSEITKQKLKKAIKKLWQNPEYKEKQLKAMSKGLNLKPNKPEKSIDKLLQEFYLNQYKYVGGGEVWIGDANPDFINISGQKKIIEHFGEYHHGEEKTGRTKEQEEQQRIEHFAKYGYRTLIIWWYELEDIEKLKEKIMRFNEKI